MDWWNSWRLRSRNAQARQKTVERLAADGKPASRKWLFACLEDSNPEVRCAAIKGIASCQGEECVRALVGMLSDRDATVRGTAAMFLGKSGDQTASAAIEVLLQDPDPGVRGRAAQALQTLHWRAATEEQQALFELATGNLRSAARRDPAAVTSLVEDLRHHETSFQRRAAAEALNESNDPRRVRPLLEAVRDPDFTVRVSAIHALGLEAGDDVSNALLNSLGDPEARVRLAAAEELYKRSDASHIPFFVGLLSDPHFELRLVAVQFLSRTSDPQYAEAMLPLLSDRDNDVRLAAARALGLLGNPVAIQPLVLVLTDEERAIREAAGASLDQIDPQWICSEAAQGAIARLEQLACDSRSWVSSAAGQVLSRFREAMLYQPHLQ